MQPFQHGIVTLRIAFIYLTTVASKATSKTQLGNQETTKPQFFPIYSCLLSSSLLLLFLSDADTFGSSCFLIEADGIISEFLRFWTSGIHSMKLTKTSRHFRNDDDLRVSYLGVKECDPVSEDQFDINGFATQIWQAAYVTNPHTSQASN